MKNIIYFIFFLLFTFDYSFADTWTQKLSLTGARDGAVGFSIGNKGYIGTGFNTGASTYYQDFWEFNPDSNTWTQKADFGGGYRSGSFSFSIGLKGFIGTGLSAGGHKNDFWQWDQVSNTWVRKGDFPGGFRDGAVGFSIGTKGYIGTGGINPPLTLYKDFWEWDGDSSSVNYDTWTQKSDFGGIERGAATGFSIGKKGYIGTGTIDGTSQGGMNDFWEWDQASNIWIQKTNFNGISRAAAVGFSVGKKGYIGTGTDTFGSNTQDFWEWDGDTSSSTYNTWIQKANFGGAPRWIGTGFSIGNKGYIGMGFLFTVSTNDFWEYCDTCSGVGIDELSNSIEVEVYPNPASEFINVTTSCNNKNLEVEIYNTSGEKKFEKRYRNFNTPFQINVSSYQPGIYFLKLIDGRETFYSKIIVQH